MTLVQILLLASPGFVTVGQLLVSPGLSVGRFEGPVRQPGDYVVKFLD